MLCPIVCLSCFSQWASEYCLNCLNRYYVILIRSNWANLTVVVSDSSLVLCLVVNQSDTSIVLSVVYLNLPRSTSYFKSLLVVVLAILWLQVCVSDADNEVWFQTIDSHIHILVTCKSICCCPSVTSRIEVCCVNIIVQLVVLPRVLHEILCSLSCRHNLSQTYIDCVNCHVLTILDSTSSSCTVSPLCQVTSSNRELSELNLAVICSRITIFVLSVFYVSVDLNTVNNYLNSSRKSTTILQATSDWQPTCLHSLLTSSNEVTSNTSSCRLCTNKYTEWTTILLYESTIIVDSEDTELNFITNLTVNLNVESINTKTMFNCNNLVKTLIIIWLPSVQLRRARLISVLVITYNIETIYVRQILEANQYVLAVSSVNKFRNTSSTSIRLDWRNSLPILRLSLNLYVTKISCTCIIICTLYSQVVCWNNITACSISYSLSLASSVVYCNCIKNILTVFSSLWNIRWLYTILQLNLNSPKTSLRCTGKKLVIFLYVNNLNQLIQVVTLWVDQLDHIRSNLSVNRVDTNQELRWEVDRSILYVWLLRICAMLTLLIIHLLSTECIVCTNCTCLEPEITLTIPCWVMAKVPRTHQANLSYSSIQSVDTTLVTINNLSQVSDAIRSSLVDNLSQRIQRTLELSSCYVRLSVQSQFLQLIIQTCNLCQSCVGRILSSSSSCSSIRSSCSSIRSSCSSVSSISKSLSYISTILSSECLYCGNLCGVGTSLCQSLLSLCSCVLCRCSCIGNLSFQCLYVRRKSSLVDLFL